MNKKTTYIILGIAVIVILVVMVTIGIILRKPKTAPVEGPSAPAPTETGIPAATPTEEEKKEELPKEITEKTPGLSSCVVLDEEYCKKGEPLYYQGSFPPGLQEYRGKLFAIGFILPKGTKVYAPADGIYTTGGWANVKTTSVILPEVKSGLFFTFNGVTTRSEFEELFRNPDRYPEKIYTVKGWGGEAKLPRIKKGELIGTVNGELIDTCRVSCDFFAENKKYTMMIFIDEGYLQKPGKLIEPNELIEMFSVYFPYIK